MGTAGNGTIKGPQETPTGKSHSRYTEIRSWSLWSSLVVRGPWFCRFVLKEDGDSGHGKAQNWNIVRAWKEENNFEYFFNCAYFTIFPLLRIVGCPSSNTRRDIRIGMIILPKSWFWRGGPRFLNSSSTSDVDQYPKDSEMSIKVRTRWLVINCSSS